MRGQNLQAAFLIAPRWMRVILTDHEILDSIPAQV
jgi:hypothetical protein